MTKTTDYELQTQTVSGRWVNVGTYFTSEAGLSNAREDKADLEAETGNKYRIVAVTVEVIDA